MDTRKFALWFVVVFVATMPLLLFGFKHGDTSTDAVVECAALAAVIAGFVSTLVGRRHAKR